MPIDDTRRKEIEADLAKQISYFSATTRRRILELIGDPPSLDNLTPDVYRTLAIELNGILGVSLENTFKEAANALMTNIGFTGVNTDLINEGAVNWARNYTPPVVNDMIAYRQKETANYVADFFEGTINRTGLEDRIARLYSPEKAAQIAITESTRAANEGQRPVIEELESEGVIMRGVFQTVSDGLVCPICQPLNGEVSQVEGFETRFTSNNKDFRMPPLHVGCRCLVSFEYQE